MCVVKLWLVHQTLCHGYRSFGILYIPESPSSHSLGDFTMPPGLNYTNVINFTSTYMAITHNSVFSVAVIQATMVSYGIVYTLFSLFLIYLLTSHLEQNLERLPWPPSFSMTSVLLSSCQSSHSCSLCSGCIGLSSISNTFGVLLPHVCDPGVLSFFDLPPQISHGLIPKSYFVKISPPPQTLTFSQLAFFKKILTCSTNMQHVLFIARLSSEM